MRERELRERLRALARRDAEAAPPFERIWGRAQAGAADPPRRRSARGRQALGPATRVIAVRRLARVAAGASAVSVAVWALALRSPETELAAPAEAPAQRSLAAGEVALSDWQGPLDFLLETPGLDLIESTPRFGIAAVPAVPEPTEGGRS